MAALSDSKLTETSIAAAVCCSDWFAGATEPAGVGAAGTRDTTSWDGEVVRLSPGAPTAPGAMGVYRTRKIPWVTSRPNVGSSRHWSVYDIEPGRSTMRNGTFSSMNTTPPPLA